MALVLDTSNPLEGVTVILPVKDVPLAEKLTPLDCAVPYVFDNADPNVTAVKVGVDKVPVNFTSSKRNEFVPVFVNRNRKFDADGMVPVAVFNVHVLAVMVELTVNAVNVVPSVLYSTVGIVFAVAAKIPKLNAIEE